MLESTQRVDTIVLDKTGTVTTGRMALVGVTVVAGADEDEIVRLVGALEAASEHPIGRAIAAAAEERTGSLPAVESFSNRAGLGVEGVVDGHAVVAGRPSLMADWGLILPRSLARARAEAEAAGQTAVLAGSDGAAVAVFAVADVDGFWQPLLDLFEHLYRERFARPESRDSYSIARTAADVMAMLDVPPVALPGKWL